MRAPEILANARRSPVNVRLGDLLRLAEAVGYVAGGQSGVHRVLAHCSRRELPLINLQADGDTATPYQVRLLLRLIDDHRLPVGR